MSFLQGVNEPTVLAGNNTTMVILSLLFQKKNSDFWRVTRKSQLDCSRESLEKKGIIFLTFRLFSYFICTVTTYKYEEIKTFYMGKKMSIARNKNSRICHAMAAIEKNHDNTNK